MYLGVIFVSWLDISLSLRPVSFIIRRLRKTFRVSLQCHRAAMVGSRADSNAWRFKAACGSTDASWAWSGRALYKSRSWGVSKDSDSAKESEMEDSGHRTWDAEVVSEDSRRFANIRRCNQYIVPPATIGIWFFECVSSICEGLWASIRDHRSRNTDGFHGVL